MSTIIAAPAVTKTITLTNISCKENQKGEVYYQLAFEQMVDNPNQVPSLLSQFNKGDERFATAKSRKTWIMASPESILEFTGVTLDKLEALNVDEEIEINITNFKINGNQVNIQLTEYTESEVKSFIETASTEKSAKSWEYYIQNREKKAKHLPTTGEYFVSKEGNELVFQVTTLVEGEPKHRFIPTVRLSKDIIFGAEEVAVEEVEEVEEVVTTTSSRSETPKLV